MKTLLAICLLSLLPSALIAQDKDEHLIRTLDKFRDTQIIQTKPDDLDARVGKDRTAVGFSAIVAITPKGKPTEVLLYFTPNTFSVAGSGRRQAYEVYDRRVNFKRDSDVILLLGDEKIKLAFTEKEIGLSSSSQWQDGFYTAVPIETFKKMAEMKWEMAIGAIEIDCASEGKTISRRVRPRLQALVKALEKEK